MSSSSKSKKGKGKHQTKHSIAQPATEETHDSIIVKPRPYSAPAVMTSSGSALLTSSSGRHSGEDFSEEEQQYFASREYYELYHATNPGERNPRLPPPTFQAMVSRSRGESDAMANVLSGLRGNPAPSAGVFSHLQGLASLRVKKERSAAAKAAVLAASGSEEESSTTGLAPDTLIGDLPEKHRIVHPAVESATRHIDPAAVSPKQEGEGRSILGGKSSGGGGISIDDVDDEEEDTTSSSSESSSSSDLTRTSVEQLRDNAMALAKITRIQRKCRRYIKVTRAQRALAIVHLIKYLRDVVLASEQNVEGKASKGSSLQPKLTAGLNLPSRLVKFLRRFSQITDLANSETETRNRAIEALWGTNNTTTSETGGGTTLQAYFSQCVLEYEYKLQVDNYALNEKLKVQEDGLREWARLTGNVSYEFVKTIVGRRAVLSQDELDEVLLTIYKASEQLSGNDFVPLKSLVGCPAHWQASPDGWKHFPLGNLDALQCLVVQTRGASVGIPLVELGIDTDTDFKKRRRRESSSGSEDAVVSSSSRSGEIKWRVSTMDDKENAPPVAPTTRGVGTGSSSSSSSTPSSTPSSAAEYEPYLVHKKSTEKTTAAIFTSTNGVGVDHQSEIDGAMMMSATSPPTLRQMPILGAHQFPAAVDQPEILIPEETEFDKRMRGLSPESMAREEELRKETAEIVASTFGIADVDSDDERTETQRRRQMECVNELYHDQQEEDATKEEDGTLHRNDGSIVEEDKQHLVGTISAGSNDSELATLWGLDKPGVLEEEEKIMEEAESAFRAAVDLPPKLSSSPTMVDASSRRVANLNAGSMVLSQGMSTVAKEAAPGARCIICDFEAEDGDDGKMYLCTYCGNPIHSECAWKVDKAKKIFFCQRRCAQQRSE